MVGKRSLFWWEDLQNIWEKKKKKNRIWLLIMRVKVKFAAQLFATRSVYKCRALVGSSLTVLHWVIHIMTWYASVPVHSSRPKAFLSSPLKERRKRGREKGKACFVLLFLSFPSLHFACYACRLAREGIYASWCECCKILISLLVSNNPWKQQNMLLYNFFKFFVKFSSLFPLFNSVRTVSLQWCPNWKASTQSNTDCFLLHLGKDSVNKLATYD